MTNNSLALRAERLRQSSWLDAIGKAWLILWAGIFVKLILPHALANSLRPLLLLAPLLPLVAKDLSHLPDALARTRAAMAARAWPALFTAWLPPELVGLIRVGRDLRHGCLSWLLRRPQPELPAGRAFSYLERGSYGTACAIVLFSTFVELPLSAAILPYFVHEAGTLRVIHLLMLAGSLSSLVWVLGDRWLVGAGRHVLTGEGLQLRIGARTRGAIPLEAIARCERISEPAADWLRRHGIDPRRAVLASPLPLDKPNTVLIFASSSRVRLTHLGVQREGLSCVFLYLDHPQELIHVVDTETQRR
jgi:hypothetical protein